MALYGPFNPTSLIAGDFPLVHRPVIVAADQNESGTPLPRGTLLGKQKPSATSAAKGGGNTGNGTLALGSPAVLADVKPGVYRVVFTSATAFAVTDPDGQAVADGENGTAFATEIGFTTTAGETAFVAGDEFDITVVLGDVIISKATAADGSQVPLGVLTDSIDTSEGAVNAMIYETGEFAWEMANVDPSWDLASLNAAFEAKPQSIFFREVGVTA